MNAPLLRLNTTLDDKYTLDEGVVFMTGTQALVRLPMLQRAADGRLGKNTATYISGYRGSPLGNYDQTLYKIQEQLSKHHIHFQPGVNEDLAATAIWGTQQLSWFPGSRYDGVMGIWYGKGPGVDRCGDVFKHVNMAGTHPWGGVLALAGDDHGAKSSTTAHQSEQIFMAVSTPVIYPASVQDILDLGLHGFALSRFSGLWSGFKCVTDVIESGSTVLLGADRIKPIIPTDVQIPPGGLNIRIPDLQFLAEEDRLLNYKLPAVRAYVRANHLNKIVWAEVPENAPLPPARLGLVSAGKAWRDLRQSLADMGISAQIAEEYGIRLYKITVTWPLEETGVYRFSQGLRELMVIEEKRPVIEDQLRTILYGRAETPVISGKRDPDTQQVLIPLNGETSPTLVTRALCKRLLAHFPGTDLAKKVESRLNYLDAHEQRGITPAKSASGGFGSQMSRLPYFCPGCPHNTSTKVPEGSRAMAGIGCHYMAQWMNRNTVGFTHMGGEGMPWVGQSPFTNEKHVFVNLGDGTYFHSGVLAIRAAVAAKVNLTYKVLYNDAVAMTGGQPNDGIVNAASIARQLYAEGVRPIVVTTDHPDQYGDDTEWPPGIRIHHRDRLDDIQRELRETPGVSAIIHDQTCAAEKRRRRKRNLYPDPPQRVIINPAVCEGCGDCSLASNCVAIEPIETVWGRKRAINQHSCNKDFSCTKGFCPSFVTVLDAKLRKPVPLIANKPSSTSGGSRLGLAPLPPIEAKALSRTQGILVNGIGGTGVITIGQIVAMAAHLEGKHCSVLDMSGLAQKGGPVHSHLWVGNSPDEIHATRINSGAADVLIGCDLIISSSKETTDRLDGARTHGVINAEVAPTAEFIRNPQWQAGKANLVAGLQKSVGDTPTTPEENQRLSFIPATQWAIEGLSDTMASNMIMLGYALQKLWLPVGSAALEKAITLNQVSVKMNLEALLLGRYAACDMISLEEALKSNGSASKQRSAKESATPSPFTRLSSDNSGMTPSPSQSPTWEPFVSWLTEYQNKSYAEEYRTFMEQVHAIASKAMVGGEFTVVVAKNLYKLMAYKDEYEVARLHTSSAFMAQLKEQFEPGFRLQFHLAPPLLSKRNHQGELIKSTYGAWVLPAFRILAGLKGLRGTALDIFGYTAERRMERQLIQDYRQTIQQILPRLNADTLASCLAIAGIPEQIRGYGHVKERHLKIAMAKRDELLNSLPR